MPTVTILGGHGKVALLLAKELSDRAVTVRSVFRKSAQEADIAATGAEPRLLDIEHASLDELVSVMQGSDAVVWSAGCGGGNRARTYAVDRDAAILSMKAAKQALVDRFIMVSFLGSGKNHGFQPGDALYDYAEAKAAADAFLEAESGLNWTILEPGMLTLEPQTEKIVLNPPPSDSLRGVSRANVALVAATVLSAPNTVKKHVPFLDGPTPIAEAIEKV